MARRIPGPSDSTGRRLMHYSETKQQASELLRLIVPQLAKHEAACTPLAFTLWYEYLAGVNPPLKTALDEIIDQRHSLTDAQVEALYNKHVRKRDEARQDQYESEFKRLVDGVSGVTTAANKKTGDFADSLSRHGSELGSLASAAQLSNITQSMLNDTLLMRESMSVLNEELRASLKEVELLRKELERTQTQAMIDPLTGLKNRRGVERVIEDLHGEGRDGLHGCSVLMVDIDDFKRINDAHGHLLGDKVIRTVAQLLVAAVKGKDTVSRWGGEEFLVLLPDTPLAGASALAEGIRSTIERGRIRRMDSSEYIGSVTVSVGAATYRPSEPFDEFVQRADLALYAAKRSGRNRVMCARDNVALAAGSGTVSVQV